MKRQAPHATQQPQLQAPTPTLQPPTPALQPPALQPRAAYCTPARSASLSKTKNVPKLTSKISSSSRINCGTVSHKCTSGAGPTAPVADAPGIAIDTPTTPTTGTAFFRCFRCFCFVRSIVQASHA